MGSMRIAAVGVAAILALVSSVGQVEVDYKTIFAKADLAGLRHFCIERDNAAEGGDSMAAAKAQNHDPNRVLGRTPKAAIPWRPPRPASRV